MAAAATVPIGAAVPSLTRWGLTSDADLVFRTMATFGPRAVRALASELGLPRQRIDDALAQLLECGAAVPSAAGGAGRGAPLWSSRAPADVVDTLRSRRLRLVDTDAQAREHRAVVHMLNARLAGLGLPACPAVGGTVGDGVRFLRTRDITRQRLMEVASQERHEHLTINTEQVFDVRARSVGAPATREQAERGLRFRVLGQPPADRDALHPDSTDHLINGTSYQYRESPLTPLKLFVCDHRLAMFPVDPLDFERGYLEVTEATVVAALVGLFEKHWDTGTDPHLHSVPVISLSTRERDLIRLLALGHTDLTAARNLRISARSVTNVLRALMDRLGVENRFQLGLTLGAMRIATPPSLDAATAKQTSLAKAS